MLRLLKHLVPLRYTSRYSIAVPGGYERYEATWLMWFGRVIDHTTTLVDTPRTRPA